MKCHKYPNKFLSLCGNQDKTIWPTFLEEVKLFDFESFVYVNFPLEINGKTNRLTDRGISGTTARITIEIDTQLPLRSNTFTKIWV